MTPVVNLSFVAPDLESFLSALAALKASNVAHATSVTQSATTTLPVTPKPVERTHGPNEMAFLAASGRQRMKMTEDEKTKWNGDREAYAAHILANFPRAEQESVVDKLPEDDGAEFGWAA